MSCILDYAVPVKNRETRGHDKEIPETKDRACPQILARRYFAHGGGGGASTSLPHLNYNENRPVLPSHQTMNHTVLALVTNLTFAL